MEKEFLNYTVKKVSAKIAKEYIIKHHYSHGCSNAPSPCYALYEQETKKRYLYIIGSKSEIRYYKKLCTYDLSHIGKPNA